MRDRLIELLKQKSCVYVPCDNECGGCKNVEMYDDSIESIADHLLSEGVIVLPCKVGDTVYADIIHRRNGDFIDECEVHYFSNTECGKEDYCCSIMDGCKPLKRPPQSWCYVESEDTE